jgi:hemolysin-activating ACP:hemolysin acyltransferase
MKELPMKSTAVTSAASPMGPADWCSTDRATAQTIVVEVVAPMGGAEQMVEDVIKTLQERLP